jgi:DNA topoisomerase-1
MSLATKSETLTIGHERSRLVPSEIGTTIDDFMEKHFNYIIDRKFTATMEDDLDKIADGAVSKLQMLTSFWKVFGEDIHRIETVKKAEKEERVKLNNRQLTFTVNGIEYIVRLTKYGPVIQFQNGSDTKYIDIRMYLKYHGKSYTSITEEDIKYVTSLPKRYAKDLYLTMGPYGLYFKYVNENVKIPLKMIKRIVNGDTLTTDEIQYVLNAHAAKMKTKTEAKAKRLSAKNAKSVRK